MNIRKLQVQISNNGRPNSYACGGKVINNQYIVVGIHNHIKGRLDYVVSVCKYVEGLDDYRQYLDGNHEVLPWKHVIEMPVEIEYDLTTPLKSKQYVGEHPQPQGAPEQDAEISTRANYDLPEGFF